MREDQFNREHKPSGETFQDVEIVWYPEFEYYCFQAHPEFGHAATTALFFKHMKELYI